MYTVRPTLSSPYKLLLGLRAQRFSSTSSHALTGKKCVITGGSRGIGLAIARRFACEGADTTLIGRDENTLQRAVESVKSACGGVGNHVARVGDVARREFWEELRRESVRSVPWRRILMAFTEYASVINQKAVDILVNAAGIPQGPFLVLTSAELANQIIQTNLMGTIWGCQAMVKGMIKQRRALTRSLAQEVGQGNIRVNALLPGFIETKIAEVIPPEVRKQVTDVIPAKRFGTVEEVADAAYFLAVNTYANNCVLNLDGGLSAT
ncbi:hypothetical protein GP486_001194 [Trichoglossum hirsutum]|uniref:Uncharacterized protein n=1 Tax=Trichoglossum hirsutum TaxID=265104 RepID=A0A9P8LHI7_9PEZI|nr:hypothetical protein GP486_001194 [Trichoglossum hirsutum]